MEILTKETRKGVRQKNKEAIVLISVLNFFFATSAQPVNPVQDVFFDLHHLYKWDESRGDTWDPFWADDDNLYSFSDDGYGFGNKGSKDNPWQTCRNLVFNKLSGNDLYGLKGTQVNSMDEYGIVCQKEADNATWKACGGECIDSVFYGFVSRHVYGSESGDYWNRQTAFNSSLIKSTDHGRTWVRSAKENYEKPMWPGAAFGAPFFVHYGKNGGKVTLDEADRYVYAVSTNGFWNNGDQFILGRVLRAKLPKMNSSDWTYFAGEGRWSGKIENAVPILSSPMHCGMTAPCYIQALGIYAMVVWYSPEKAKFYTPSEIRYDIYQAEHIWGPWKPVNSLSNHFLNGCLMWGPSLCAKFQETSGNEVKIHLFTSGYPDVDEPGGLYKAWTFPVILKTEPCQATSVVSADVAAITYKGFWTVPCNMPKSFRYSTSAGDIAQLRFKGTGIAWIAEKAEGYGSADVFVDDKLVETVTLGVQNLPRLSGITVFRSENLAPGEHTLRIVNRENSGIVLESFRIYGELLTETVK